MEVKEQPHPDGSVTFSITLPANSSGESLLQAETRLMEAVNGVGRAAVKHVLAGYDTDGSALERENRNWTTKGRTSKIYETPWGEVMVERHVYQSSAGGRTWCPLEDRARVTGGTATPHLARSLAHKYANMNARAVVRDLEENHGRKLAPSYVADIAEAVAAAAGNPVVEAAAHTPQTPAGTVKTITLGLDATCALFCQDGYKQCMVGTIALYDAQGERQETIYLAQEPAAGKEQFLARLDAEWNRLRAHYPKAVTQGLSDGARDYEPWLAARTTWQTLDFYHASGYLAGAAAGMARGKKARAAWLADACHRLRHTGDTAAELAGALRRTHDTGSGSGNARKALGAAATYFENNAPRMNYALCDAMNMPVGSGVTEAACKTLVKARLCGSGMRWTREGAKTVLTLRALLLSESRWKSLWQHLDENGI